VRKAVNWRQAAAEVSLILLALLLAFSVDRLWETRQDQDSKAAYLSRLSDEFGTIRTDLRDAILRLEDMQAARQAVLGVLAEDDLDQIEGKLAALLPIAFDGFLLSLLTSTYDELESTGRLELLSPDLMSALSRFDATMQGEFARIEAAETEMWIHRAQPFLDTNLSPDVYLSRTDREALIIPASPFPTGLGNISTRRELWSMMSHRIIFGSVRIQLLQTLLEIDEDVLEGIASSEDRDR
jgi:hypothetical protein